MAPVVIRIGRSLSVADFDDGLADRVALCAELIGELDDQNAVLGDEPNQGDETNLAIDVERAAAPPQREQRAGDGERHSEHDDERILEALELRGKHQIDEGERKHEGEIDAGTRLLELARLPGIVDAGRRRQHVLGGLLEIVESFAQRVARREMRGDHGRA